MAMVNTYTIKTLQLLQMRACTKGSGPIILSKGQADRSIQMWENITDTGLKDKDMVKVLCHTVTTTCTQVTGPMAKRMAKAHILLL